uniref:Uncharacterized protein n=1 Tax=Mesocestoides corti TaxID=53468 RepID=A0A5K3FZK3_MESCO
MLLPCQPFIVSNRGDAIHQHHPPMHASTATSNCVIGHLKSRLPASLRVLGHMGNAAVAVTAGAFTSLRLFSREPQPTSSLRFQQPTTNHPLPHPATTPTYLRS